MQSSDARQFVSVHAGSIFDRSELVEPQRAGVGALVGLLLQFDIFGVFRGRELEAQKQLVRRQEEVFPSANGGGSREFSPTASRSLIMCQQGIYSH